MSAKVDAGASVDGSLSDSTLDRLTCLWHHWAWASDIAMCGDRSAPAPPFSEAAISLGAFTSQHVTYPVNRLKGQP